MSCGLTTSMITFVVAQKAKPLTCPCRSTPSSICLGGRSQRPVAKVDFDAMCKAFGVTIDVSLMHHGRVLVDNTEARKRELGEFIDKIVSTRKLSSADALKLRGRMQFTAGQLFGRVAKTCLARVTNHAYRSSSSDVNESLVSSLTLFKRCTRDLLRLCISLLRKLGL